VNSRIAFHSLSKQVVNAEVSDSHEIVAPASPLSSGTKCVPAHQESQSAFRNWWILFKKDLKAGCAINVTLRNISSIMFLRVPLIAGPIGIFITRGLANDSSNWMYTIRIITAFAVLPPICARAWVFSKSMPRIPAFHTESDGSWRTLYFIPESVANIDEERADPAKESEDAVKATNSVIEFNSCQSGFVLFSLIASFVWVLRHSLHAILFPGFIDYVDIVFPLYICLLLLGQSAWYNTVVSQQWIWGTNSNCRIDENTSEHNKPLLISFFLFTPYWGSTASSLVVVASPLIVNSIIVLANWHQT